MGIVKNVQTPDLPLKREEKDMVLERRGERTGSYKGRKNIYFPL
jgi:hypothetical protein